MFLVMISSVGGAMIGTALAVSPWGRQDRLTPGQKDIRKLVDRLANR